MNNKAPSEKNELETILRDHLAAVRTILANERTFLAYIRTALSFLVAGAFFIKFVDTPGMTVIGWLMIPMGPLTVVIGLNRYWKTQQDLHALK